MMRCCITAATAPEDTLPAEHEMPNTRAITATGLLTDFRGGEPTRLVYCVAVAISNPHSGFVTPTLSQFTRFSALLFNPDLATPVRARLGTIQAHLALKAQRRNTRNIRCRPTTALEVQISRSLLDPVLPVLSSFGTVRGCHTQRLQAKFLGNYDLLLICQKAYDLRSRPDYPVNQRMPDYSSDVSTGCAGPSNSGKPEARRMAFSISKQTAGFSFKACLAFSRPWARRSSL